MLSFSSLTQQFVGTTILGMTNAGVDWGDYDNDNDLDLIMIGYAGNNHYSRIYTNNLGTSYSDIVSPGVPLGYVNAETNWCDFDNDGDLDYAMTGNISSCTYSPIVKNEDIGLDANSIRSFVLPPLGLQGVYDGSVDWGDYDNDGDYDLIILGGNGNFSQRYAIIYENVNNTMVIHVNLVGLARGVAKWADIDNDLDLDVFISGEGTSGNQSYIYVNNNGIFTNSTNSIVAVSFGDADFGDYDNDGDLDLVVCGDSSLNTPVTRLYNNSAGIFTPVITNFFQIRKSTVRWGDYDNDGDLDLIAVGDTTHTTFGDHFMTSIYRNDGANVFVPIVHTIKGYKDANARWADQDKDGDLDFILTGYSYQFPYNAGEVYNNQLSVSLANTIPNTPSGLTTTVNNYNILFDWNTATDNQTPSLGLNYNISVGTTPGGVEIVSPQADLQSGFRRKAEVGNTGSSSAWRLKNVLPGDYYWRVQSIDGAFAGSSFSSEKKVVVYDTNAPTLHYPFHEMTDVKIDTSLIWYSYPGAISYQVQLDTMGNFITPLMNISVLSDTLKPFLLNLDQLYYWRVRAFTAGDTTEWSMVRRFRTVQMFSFDDQGLHGVMNGEVAFGDFDNDNDLDFVMAGDKVTGAVTGLRKIYLNDNNTFSDYNATLSQNTQGTCSWGDYDKDNDLDLLITGVYNSETRVYQNAAGSFLDNGNIYAMQTETRKTAWADFDNDGDLDFALLGVGIFRNNNGAFALISVGFANTTNGDLAWGDFDKDLDMDLIVTGSNIGSGFTTRIYRNNGNSTFTEVIGHGIVAQTNGARVRCGDLDQDGDLDLLLCGQTYNIPFRWSVYKNNGGSFSLHQQVNDGIAHGDIEWGDLDNDGDLDVVVSGENKSYIYLYANQHYTREITLQGFSRSSIELGDYDNDLDLDILMAGSVNNYPITKLYKNNGNIHNTIPNPPTNLTAINDNGTVKLSWNPGTDAQTAATGLTYNFYFSSVPGGTNLASPMAHVVTGKRRVTAIGNANSNLEWVLENVPYGTYYWSVQSIDNNYDGSHFAPEQTIIVDCKSNKIQKVTACESYTWIDNNTYTANNDTATWVLTNTAGCDSTIALKLTILQSSFGTDIHSACVSYTWVDGNTYSASNNTATFNYINAVGCDSTVTLNLNISNPSAYTDVHNACETYTWMNGVTYINSTNGPTHVLTNAAGCDSIITLDLTITHSSNYVDVQTACDSYTWIDGNTYTSSNNTAVWTTANAVGCDSTIQLNLTITPPPVSTDEQFACNSYTWINGITYTSSNNSATWTLTNVNGCDSIVTLDLTITAPTSAVDVQTACNSYTWIDGITYTTNNNSATWIVPNTVGCDSLITLNLTLTNSSNGTDVQTACDSYTWIDGNTYTTNNNSANWIISNADGCDSLITLNLTMINSSSGIDVQTACESFTWIDGNTYTSNTTTATYVLSNSNGCDSVVTLHLTLTNLIEDVSQIDAMTLHAYATDVSYQWLDCGKDFLPISGETNQVYTATENGSYAVLITSNGCSDTSACITIDELSVVDPNANAYLIHYPNPSMDGIIHIKYESKICAIAVCDMQGRKVDIEVNEELDRVDASKLEPGTYMILFETDQGVLISEFTLVY